MSVDDRLRDAFQTAPEPVGTLADTLDAVHTTVRRHTVTRRASGAFALAAASVAVLLALQGGSDPQTVGPVEQPTPPAPTSMATSDSVAELHEWWRTRELNAADLRQTLESAGLGKWSDVVIDDLPNGTWTLTLSIQGRGYWTLTANKGDTDVVIDRETVTADGRRMVLSPQFADGQNTYDYSIRTTSSGERVLRLVFLNSTEAPSNGAPGEAFQRALYTSAPFKEFF